MPRDSQRAKLYTAEESTNLEARGDKLALDEAQALVDKMSASSLRERYPRAAIPCLIRDGRGARHAFYRPLDETITLPRFARTRYIVLHEFAHHLLADERAGIASHGWEFAECLLYLVRIYMGRGDEQTLKAAFKAHRVKFRPPRKRNLTDAQRAAARERIIAVNAAKAAKAEPPPEPRRVPPENRP
jgi:putative metallohydrolase (TIGR04338 family)